MAFSLREIAPVFRWFTFLIVASVVVACGRATSPVDTNCPVVNAPLDDGNWYDSGSTWYGPVEFHPDLHARVVEAVLMDMRVSHTMETLGIESAGKVVEIHVQPSGISEYVPDYWDDTEINSVLPDGRQLHTNVHTWGQATFEDGSVVEFQVFVGSDRILGFECGVWYVTVLNKEFI